MAKNYIKWSAKMVKTQYWEILNLSLSLEDLQRLPQYKWYVRLTIAPRKEPGQYGDTHSIFENDYQPNWQSSNDTPSSSTNTEDEDLPF